MRHWVHKKERKNEIKKKKKENMFLAYHKKICFLFRHCKVFALSSTKSSCNFQPTQLNESQIHVILTLI